MNFRKVKYILPLLSVLLFAGCEAEIDEFTPDAGEIDLTTFVTIGNSLTAGFADNALYRSGQINSFGNILAGQLMHAGLQEFKQPLMKDETGGGVFPGHHRLILADVNGSLLPAPMPVEHDPANSDNIFESEGPFHNMGVPGARTNHLLAPGYGSAQGNPYFARFASSPATTVMADAMALDPTFFSLWIGSNDILGFAISGGESDAITPAVEFQQAYNAIIGQLTSNGAKGVLGNIPGITVIPFFNTIPYNPVELEDQNIVDMLNNAYIALPHINFSIGDNPLVVEDMNPEFAPFFRRQLEAGELVLLTAMSLLNDPEINYGVEVPLPAQYYLSLDQIAEIEQAVNDYNAIIVETADAQGLPVADIFTILNNSASGIYFDGIEFTTEFVAGGAFSLDGIHLSARGNAIAANEFIAAINRAYNARIPKAQVGEFHGIIFP